MLFDAAKLGKKIEYTKFFMLKFLKTRGAPQSGVLPST